MSIGQPGPMVPSHQPTSPWPGPGGPGGVAVAGERVQHEHRVRRVGRERAPRLVRDGDRLERAAGLELQAVGERRRTGGGRGRRPAATPVPVTRSALHARAGGRVTALLAARNPASRSARMSSIDSMPDREAHEVGGDAGGRLLVGVELLVGGGRRVDGEAAHVAHVGEVAVQLERVDELLARPRGRPRCRRRRSRPRPGAGTAARARATGSTPGRGTSPSSTSSRASSHCATASAFCAVPLHAQRQRLEALQEQERVERRRSPAPMSRRYWSRALRMYCAGRSGSGSCEKIAPW